MDMINNNNKNVKGLPYHITYCELVALHNFEIIPTHSLHEVT